MLAITTIKLLIKEFENFKLSNNCQNCISATRHFAATAALSRENVSNNLKRSRNLKFSQPLL